MRERSRRELGPRDQEEQPTQRAPSVATYHTSLYESTHRAAALIVLGSDAWLKKYHVKRLGTSLRGQTKGSQRRLRYLSPGPSEVPSARRQT